jgi:hypothetical protein
MNEIRIRMYNNTLLFLNLQECHAF